MNEQTQNSPDPIEISHHVLRALAVPDLLGDAVTRPEFNFDWAESVMVIDVISDELKTAIKDV